MTESGELCSLFVPFSLDQSFHFPSLGEFGVPEGKGERNPCVLTSTDKHFLRSPAEFQLDDYHELLRNFDWSTIIGLAYNFREWEL